MKRILIITAALLIALTSYGQTTVNKRIMLDSLNNKISWDTPDKDDAATIFPTIQSAAGDTSNYDTPDKIGDLYIDTSAGKVYVSVAAARGGWRILNYFLPLFMFWNLKRRRRK